MLEKEVFKKRKLQNPIIEGSKKKFVHHPPPKWASNFFMHESCWKIKSCPWCVQILFLFTRRVVNSPKCSGFKPFLNRIFIRGDTFIFMKKSDKIYLKKWGGGDAFEIDLITGFWLKTTSTGGVRILLQLRSNCPKVLQKN